MEMNKHIIVKFVNYLEKNLKKKVFEKNNLKKNLIK